MDNRDKILSQARELFYSKGYDATGVQEIALAAGVTKPTLYYYFGSKYGLLTSLVQHDFTPLLDGLRELADHPVSLEEDLFQMARLYLQGAMGNPSFYFLFLSLLYAPRGSDGYRAIQPAMHQQYESACRLFSQDSRTSCQASQLALTFTGMLNHTLLGQMELHHGQALSPQQLHMLVSQFLHGALG
ncbi:MAG: TetR/AcrR family transcriptional regulator [Eubacteriales bacterium]